MLRIDRNIPYVIPTTYYSGGITEKGILTTYIPEAHCQPEGPLICETLAVELGVVVGAQPQVLCQEADL
jgi:hypothetical protein